MLILTAIRTQIKWILAMFIIIFTASIGFMYGTGRSGGDSGRSGDFVVARINGDDLRISTLQQYLRSYVERNGIRDLSDKQIPLIYKAVLDELVSNRAIINEVSRLKISAPADDVNAQIKAIESQYVTKEAFYQAIKNQGQTLDQVKNEIARELAIKKMLDDVAGGEVVSDDEAKTLYDALQGNFTLPAGIEVDFAHLKTKESAEKLAAAVKENGDWDAAIETVKDDVVQNTSGGEHERIAAREMTGTLEPLTALNDGDVCAPLELTENDYIVVRRFAAVPESVRPFEEVADGLKEMLLQSKKLEAQQKYIKELTDKMNVEILTPDIFTVPESPAEDPLAVLEPNAETAPTPEGAAEPAATENAPTEEAKAEETAPAENTDAPAAETIPAESGPAPAEVPADPATEAAPAEEVTAGSASEAAPATGESAAEIPTEPAAEVAPAETAPTEPAEVPAIVPATAEEAAAAEVPMTIPEVSGEAAFALPENVTETAAEAVEAVKEAAEEAAQEVSAATESAETTENK